MKKQAFQDKPSTMKEIGMRLANNKNMNPMPIDRSTRNINDLSSRRIVRGSLRFFAGALVIIALGWALPGAHAGVIRQSGKMLAKGTTAAASATASAGAAAADSAQGAVKATGSVMGRGASAAGNAVVSAGKATVVGVNDGAVAVAHNAPKVPGAVAHGAAAGAGALWHFIW